ncbi:MAG TPA: hypothetical protein VJ785_06215 [Anaerolineales bacterium]|nr:hypothetical protein [Anaerolineales bacterium]
MQDDYQLDDMENFKIDPHTWLRTLLAILGDKEKKANVIQIIAEKTGFTTEEAELIMTTIMGVLINDTRSN